MNRREFTVATGAAALTGWIAPASAAAPSPRRWAPYSDIIAVDASGGVGRVTGDPGGELNPLELADARESGLEAVLVTIAPSGPFWFGQEGFQRTTSELAKWDGRLIEHPETFTAVRSGEDFERAHRERRLGVIYGFQDTSPLGEDLDRVELFRRRGVRVIQLTHNKRNLVGDGSMEPGDAGISNYGHEVIEALNASRIVIDLAHGGRRTTREALVASKAPAIISHTGCAALSDLPRNTPDDLLRAMADRGGVAGIIFWPYLRRVEQPLAADVIAHLEHAIDVCGEDHVGIGTDSTVSPIERTPEYEKRNREQIAALVEYGIFERGRPADLYTFIPDLNHVRRFEHLGAMLSARGHSDARIAKVLGGNFARVMGDVWS